jgi:hypothetical protein
LLPSKLSPQDQKSLLQKMWQYSATNRYPDFIKDLCEFSKRSNISIVTSLQEQDNHGSSVIFHIIKESPESFTHLMPLLRELTDQEKTALCKTVTPEDGEIQNDFELTLLHFACYNKRTEILKDLLSLNTEEKKFFDVEKRSHYGSTTLHYAAVNGHTEIVKALLEKKADIEAKTNKGTTALHYAAQNGHAEIVKALLEKDADIEAKANNGMKALHCAAKNGHAEIVKALLENGADPSKEMIINGKATTPISLATTPEIKDLLEKYQNAREEIFQTKDERQEDQLIAKINSFMEGDLFTVKTFTSNEKEIQLNAYGILNLHAALKETTQSLADQGQSTQPSTSILLPKASKQIDLDLDLAIRNLKEAIEKKSSSLGKRARGDGSAGVAATKLAKQSIAAGSPGASPLL